MDLKQRQAAVMRALAGEDMGLLDILDATSIKYGTLRITLNNMCKNDVLKCQKYDKQYRYSIKRPEDTPVFTNISRIVMQRNSTWHRPGRVG